VLYFSHPVSLEHDPAGTMPGHPEAPERLLAIERLLAQSDWLGWERREAARATEAELELVHSAAHVAAIRSLCEAGGGTIDADTYASKGSWQAALRAAGGACEMAGALMSGDAEVGFCALRPPGHHAEPDRAMGFCLFNSVAIAAELAIRELGAERVFVLDWDVHHGNGTAEAFRRRDDILFTSFHQEGIFPGTGAREDTGSGPGEGYTINLPVPAGSDGAHWLSLMDEIVLPAAIEFGPDLILISAGFDAHAADPLAGCRLETEAYGEMTRRVRDLGAPMGAVLEGGYNPPVLAECVAETMTALSGAGQ
jgi:acetoin utilization deacetylase AcuC-like enzyme